MAEEEGSEDLDVELRWPQPEEEAGLRPLSPAEAREVAAVPAADADAPASGVPARAPAGEASRRDPLVRDLYRRIDTLTRAVSSRSDDAGVRRLAKATSASIAALSERVDALGRSVESEGSQRELRDLAKRVQELGSSVDSMRHSALMGESVGRVDALAAAVETLSQQVGGRGERTERIAGELRAAIGRLDLATAEIERLSDVVAESLRDRAARQQALIAEVGQLTDDIRELRKGLPVARDRGGVADAIASAVADALADGPLTPAPPRRTVAKKTAKATPAKAAQKRRSSTKR
ncbi:MAG: hypothetical protein JO086_04900 [Acidimicrobiia bacterium]|nr:hypothetical protein [Acidimicrobiia bacterium]